MKRLSLICIALFLLLLVSCMNPPAGSHGGTDGMTINQDSSNTEMSTADISPAIMTILLETGEWEMGGAWFDDNYLIGTVCLDGKNMRVLVTHGGLLKNASPDNPYDAYRIEYDTASLVKQDGTYVFDDNTVTYTYCLNAVVSITPEMIAEPEKPVIYLYPKTETEVTVTVDFNGDFTVTIPPYENGWTVTASPDGTLTDKDGKTYPYLFWEGVTSVILPMDEGFCVKGKDTEAFLLDILPRLGLIESEYTEFVAYWLPRMENNPYNVITFQTGAYEALAPLTISPAPDAVLRVFMSFRASETPVELPEQEIESFTRHGFTVVEWGGEERK